MQGHALDIINTTFNRTYLDPWIDHYGSVARQNFSSVKSYITSRSNVVLSQLPDQIPFEIITNDGTDFSVDETFVVLQGKGWIDVREIFLVGNDEPLQMEFVNGDTWQATIPLESGINQLQLEATNHQGEVVGADYITITSTVSNPYLDFLRISEIHYHPTDPTLVELAAGFTDDSQFEFIELFNSSLVTSLDLTDVQITEGPSSVFHFAGSNVTSLGPGEFVLVVADQAAFEARYGTGLRDHIAGEYTGRLSNAGELVEVLAPGNAVGHRVTYDDQFPWPERADGAGGSLQLINPSDTPIEQAGKQARWRGSTEWGGNPGEAGQPPIGVVVNEILTQTDPPVTESDSIELFNTSTGTIDISGWFLSDSSANLFKYQIPAGTVLPSGHYRVFDENHFNPNPSNPGPGDFALSGTHGDEVWLVNPHGGGPDVVWFADDVRFAAALHGESFGRTPNGSGHLAPLKTVTLGGDNDAPRVGPLVISEIQYHPGEPSPAAIAIDPSLSPNDLEFVELYNPTPQPVDLNNWQLRGGIDFEFPSGTSLGPGQFLVLVSFDPENGSNANRLSAFRVHYNIDASISLAGDYDRQLANEGEFIELQRPDTPPWDEPTFIPHVIEDQVLYDDLAPWPISVNGTGQSLHRSRVDLWGSDAATWESAYPTPGIFGPEKLIHSQVTTSVIGEVGVVTDVTHRTQTIILEQAYNNPVVFAQPLSFHGSDPAVVRVTNISPHQFDLLVTEPSNQNGTHGIEETVSYIVLEAGSHLLADGRQLEVGTVMSSATVGSTIDTPVWETVQYVTSFSMPPVVISQTQTTLGEAFLSTRQQATTADSFQVGLQQEERITTQHTAETIGYLAIEPGSGDWNGMLFEAEMTPASFTDVFSSLNFNRVYSSAPSFISSLATYNGKDNAHLRFQELTDSRIDLKVEEDTTEDTEIAHAAAESVAYLVIGGPGLLTAIDTRITDGNSQSFHLDVDETGRINDLDVTIELVHRHAEDLDIVLESPAGTLVELLSDVGGSGNRWIRTTLDDEATQSITSAVSPWAGYFQPEGSLQNISGQETAGEWTLHVTDDTVNGKAGTLAGWSLKIKLDDDIEGNLNHDGDVNAEDIDLLFANLSSADPTFDIDHDGDTDRSDIDTLLMNVMEKRFGDTDLDQDVDIQDFDTTTRHFNPEGQNTFYSWSQGNWDGDDDVDISDILKLILNFNLLEETPVSAPLWKGIEVSSDGVETLKISPIRKDENLSATSDRSPVENHPRHTLSDRARPRVLDRNRVVEENLIVDEYFEFFSRRPNDLDAADTVRSLRTKSRLDSLGPS